MRSVIGRPRVGQELSDVAAALSEPPGCTPERAALLLREHEGRLQGALRDLGTEAHPATESYGRRVVTAGPGLEVLAMTWWPGDYSAIHNHGAADWGAVLVLGDFEEAVFEVTDGTLVTRGRERRPAGHLVMVNHEFVHQLGNPGPETFSSIHVCGRWSPPEGSATVTAGSRVLSPYRARLGVSDGPAFYPMSPPGPMAGPPGDLETCFRDLVEHAARLCRVVLADQQPPEQRDAVLATLTDLLDDPALAAGLARLEAVYATPPPPPAAALDRAAALRLSGLVGQLVPQRAGEAQRLGRVTAAFAPLRVRVAALPETAA